MSLVNYIMKIGVFSQDCLEIILDLESEAMILIPYKSMLNTKIKNN